MQSEQYLSIIKDVKKTVMTAVMLECLNQINVVNKETKKSVLNEVMQINVQC